MNYIYMSYISFWPIHYKNGSEKAIQIVLVTPKNNCFPNPECHIEFGVANRSAAEEVPSKAI